MLHKLLAKLAGKKTYTALALLMVKTLAEAFGVEITADAASTTIDVILLLLAGVARSVATPAPGAPLPHER